MSTSPNEDIIDELLTRIQRLELNEAALEREVQSLQNQLQQQERALDSNPAIEAVVVHSPRSDTIQTTAEDRDGRTIRVGDRVRILTKGVHKERQGTIVELELPSWVHIKDRLGITPRRAPHNTRLIQRGQGPADIV